MLEVRTCVYVSFQGTFYLYTGIAALGFVWFLWVMPETKGKTLEDMEEVFQTEWTKIRPWKKDKNKAVPNELTGLNEQK